MKIPKLAENWKEILTKAWSVRWIVAAVFFSGAEAALAYWQADLSAGQTIPTGVFAAISGVISAVALLSRLLAQPSMLPVKEPEKKNLEISP
jgi:hypothetical protein